jgi:hypothetical protein
LGLGQAFLCATVKRMFIQRAVLNVLDAYGQPAEKELVGAPTGDYGVRVKAA